MICETVSSYYQDAPTLVKGKTVTEYEYSSAGKLTRETVTKYDANGQATSTEITLYDEQGRKSSRTREDSFGSFKYDWTYEHRASDDTEVITEQGVNVRDPTKGNTIVTEKRYDENGHIIYYRSASTRFSTGETIYTDWYTQEFESNGHNHTRVNYSLSDSDSGKMKAGDAEEIIYYQYLPLSEALAQQ